MGAANASSIAFFFASRFLSPVYLASADGTYISDEPPECRSATRSAFGNSVLSIQ